MELKIADDGEILARGPNIFRGYYKNPEATKETIVDGWLHTGDIGRIDEDGFLYITGRKKDIIITAGGKNITPANLENGLKQNQYISQAVVHGDRRPFLTALITLDPEAIVPWAQQQGIEDTDMASLAENDKVRALVQEAVDRVNSKVARVEEVKKFTILPHDLTQETGRADAHAEGEAQRRVRQVRRRAGRAVREIGSGPASRPPVTRGRSAPCGGIPLDPLGPAAARAAIRLASALCG